MTSKPKKHAGGRPPSFKKEYVAQGEKLCQLGATDEEIGDFFGVSTRTVHRWKNQYPEFCHSLKIGKDVADDRVERSLYQRAIGYRQEAVKIFMPAGASDPVYAPFVEEIQPDTTACIFWLKNRRSEQWRDKTSQELTGPDGKPLSTAPTIIFTGCPPNTPSPETVDSPADDSE